MVVEGQILQLFHELEAPVVAVDGAAEQADIFQNRLVVGEVERKHLVEIVKRRGIAVENGDAFLAEEEGSLRRLAEQDNLLLAQQMAGVAGERHGLQALQPEIRALQAVQEGGPERVDETLRKAHALLAGNGLPVPRNEVAQLDFHQNSPPPESRARVSRYCKA